MKVKKAEPQSLPGSDYPFKRQPQKMVEHTQTIANDLFECV